jgi:hypothetical protein
MLIAMASVSAGPLAHGQEQAGRTMNSLDQRMTETVAEFEKKRDPTLLYEILDSLQAAEAAIPVGDTAARKLAVTRRLRFFEVLDRSLDPTWNQNNPPPQGVPPPPVHGIVYSSGEVDPASIPDPEERARYVQALKANKDARRQYSVQFDLRRIDERAMLFFGRFLTDRYNESEHDRTEFEGLLAASAVNEARKAQLRALMARRGPGAAG